MSKSETKTTQNNEADNSQTIHSTISKRQKLKLKLAAELIATPFHTYKSSDGLLLPQTSIDNSHNDDIYIQALKRAEWMISKVEEQNSIPIEIYQFFTPDEAITLTALEKTLQDLKVTGLTTRKSIKDLMKDVWEALKELAKNDHYAKRPEQDANLFIFHKIKQITKFLPLDNRDVTDNDAITKITKDLKKSLEKHAKSQFIPKPQSMNNEEMKLQYFKEYYEVDLLEDHQELRERISSKAKDFIRPYPFFLCACILAKRGYLEPHIDKLSIPRDKVGPTPFAST